MQESERRLRIREVAAIPRVAAPTDALSRLVAQIRPVADIPRLMPIHLDNAHIHRYSETVHRVHDFAIVGIGIWPETAPPIAERPAWRKRYAPRNLYIVAKATLVVMSVGEHGQIAIFAFLSLRSRRDPLLPILAALDKKRRRRVVNNRHAAP